VNTVVAVAPEVSVVLGVRNAAGPACATVLSVLASNSFIIRSFGLASILRAIFDRRPLLPFSSSSRETEKKANSPAKKSADSPRKTIISRMSANTDGSN